MCKHMATAVAGYRKPLVSYGWAVSLLLYTAIGLEKMFSSRLYFWHYQYWDEHSLIESPNYKELANQWAWLEA